MWSIHAVAGLILLAVALYKLWQRSSSPVSTVHARIAAAVTGLIGFRVAHATANGNRWTPLLEQLS